MSHYRGFDYRIEDGVGTVTFARPDKLNSLTFEVYAELERLAVECQTDDAVRVLVLTGTGKGFCSGGDVKAMNEAKESRTERPILDKVAPSRDRTLLAMRDAPQPIIAAVNGAAAGAGMNLALGCDIRLASTAARFGETFVKRGLHPDWGGTYFLPRLVGMAKAAEMIFTGDMIDAAEALRIGLVSAVYPPEELMPAAYDLARKIANGPPIAIRLAKRALYHGEGTDLRGGLEFETFAQNVCFETEDAREGIRAFVDKRPPQFKGR